MAWAARKWRVLYEPEDTGGPFGYVYVPLPPDDEPYIDAMDAADCFTDYQAEYESPGPWRCYDCGQPWPGERGNCGICGQPRED